MTRIIESLHQQMMKAIASNDWVVALSLAIEIRRIVLKMSIEAKG